MKKYKVKESFLKEAYYAACSEWRGRIRKEFPEVFGAVIQAGKWYKNPLFDYGKALYFVESILTTTEGDLYRRGNNPHYAYGFDGDGDWRIDVYRDLDGCIEAIDEEVEYAIKREARSRGLLGGPIKCAFHGENNIRTVPCFTGESSRTALWGNHGAIFYGGKWATRIPNTLKFEKGKWYTNIDGELIFVTNVLPDESCGIQYRKMSEIHVQHHSDKGSLKGYELASTDRVDAYLLAEIKRRGYDTGTVIHDILGGEAETLTGFDGIRHLPESTDVWFKCKDGTPTLVFQADIRKNAFFGWSEIVSKRHRENPNFGIGHLDSHGDIIQKMEHPRMNKDLFETVARIQKRMVATLRTKEMTLEEIENELGHKVKIITDENRHK